MSQFKIPLFLFYDNAENKKTAGMNRDNDNVAMFLKSKLISFSDEKYAQNWKNEEMTNEQFELSISNDVLKQYECGEKENSVVYDALCQMQTLEPDSRTIYIKAHNNARTIKHLDNGDYRYTYHYVKFSEAMVRAMSRLFVSTIVYHALKIAWPEVKENKKAIPEGMMVEFDTDTHKAVVTDVAVLTSPAAIPFQKYINGVLTEIWDEIERDTEADDDKAVDFYTDLKFDKTKLWGAWHPVADLDDALDRGIEEPYGIYMLYNSKNKTFYVGKAKKVYSRMDKHRTNKNANEPMPEFDYYRFSLVDKKHIKMIYLIENAAIHDCAAIFNMPNAKTGHYNNISLQGHVTNDLNGIHMTNTDEAQTRWE